MDPGQFRQSHGAQLQRIPSLYWEALREKLGCQEYDAGNHFTMSPTEQGWKVLVTNKDGISKDDPSCIFLIDHAWTFQSQSAREQLAQIPGLATRMAALMNLMTDLVGAEDEKDSYDADSESGDEARDWETEDHPQTDVQSHTTSDLPTTLLKNDGYSSGDLGDVSHAYVTEHAQEGQSDQSDSDSDTPRKTFAERYAVPEIEKKQLSVSGTTSNREEGGQEVVEPSNQINALPSMELVDLIMKKMWSYCHAYHINNSPVPVWYIMDEFGSRIQQSLSPSVAMAVFFYIPTQMGFTVMWPIKDLQFADEVTCSHLPDCLKPGLEQACHTLPWSHDSHMTLDDPLWNELDKFTTPEPTERCNEEYPSISSPLPSCKPSYTVCTDIKVVQSYLTVPEFKVGVAEKDADILWLSEHFKEFNTLRSDQFVNQFPCENVLTCKDLLATVAKRANQTGGSPSALASAPKWLPTTFNLMYELPRLVRCFMEREQRQEENIWIIKPWNLGRGLDIHITDNLMQIIRLGQAGPKVASKYITDPVLFHRPEVGLVKFDVRYIVLLKSVSPLELYVYNVFWLRFANKPYSSDDLHDYEKHFTVMNYRTDSKLKQIHDVDFIPLFEQQYPGTPWATIQGKMYSVIKDVFSAAVRGQPPAAIAPSNQSRAIYGVDMMLKWSPSQSIPSLNKKDDPSSKSLNNEREMEPQLLEVNYCPDCIRACKYHPQFFNHVFQTLFDVEGGSPLTDVPVTRLM